jgi:hypothetical protein
MKLTKTQLRNIIREEIIKLNEGNKNDLKNSPAEKALLKGLTSVLGTENVGWAHSAIDLHWTTDEDQGECYGVKNDTNAHIYLEDRSGDFYMGVTGWSKWIVKPFKVSPNSISSYAASIAKKYKKELTSL